MLREMVQANAQNPLPHVCAQTVSNCFFTVVRRRPYFSLLPRRLCSYRLF